MWVLKHREVYHLNRVHTASERQRQLGTQASMFAQLVSNRQLGTQASMFTQLVSNRDRLGTQSSMFTQLVSDRDSWEPRLPGLVIMQIKYSP